MQPKYDVAISFLTADESIAAALDGALSEGLEVFFSPRKQEEVAGTNGLESMRTPFVDDSRIVVVVYREPWGKTPWTGVEETAIQHGCLKHGWQRLFFVMLDKTSAPPSWLPLTHVRFNYADFGLEQAVGAIKARVQESGGTITPLSALRRAQLFQQEQQYSQERRQLRSLLGRDVVRQRTAELFHAVESLCKDITASGTIPIQFASEPLQCHLRNQSVSLVVTLSERQSMIVSDSSSELDLTIRGFSKRLAFRGEILAYMKGQPEILSETTFMPDMNRAREYGWVEEGPTSSFLQPEALANTIVSQFIELAARANRQ